MYNVTRNMLVDVLEGYLKLAKEMKGEVVVLNKINDEADEFVITNLKDFGSIATKKNDMLEVTIYVDDEDEVFEEFVIGDGSDFEKVQKNIFAKYPKHFSIKKVERKDRREKKKPDTNKLGKDSWLGTNKDAGTNHFQKFMKKKQNF
ncbi:MAG: hypothetical protein ACRC5F_05655 [Cetobacterium sp.]